MPLTPEEQDRYLQEAKAAGVPDDFIQNKLKTDPGDYHRLVTSYRSGQTGSGPDQQGGPSRPAPQQSSGQGSSVSQQWAAQPTNPRVEQLYGLLMQRATQGTDVSGSPVVRAQSDAYAANEERSRRNYISDVAERGGPYANIEGERRMASERMGQRVGGFEAELMGRELAARRDEISEALTLMAGQLSGDQTRALQRELAQIEAQLAEQGMALQGRGMDLQNDQFLRELALREWDLGQTWDYRWSGL